MTSKEGTLPTPAGRLKVKRIRTWKTRVRLIREYLIRTIGLKGNN